MLASNRIRFRLPVLELGLAIAWCGALSLWLLLAVWILIRRMSGVFDQSLTGIEFLIVAAVVIGAASLFRLTARWLGFMSSGPRTWVITVLPTIASVSIVSAVSTAGLVGPWLVVAWGGLTICEAAWWLQVPRTGFEPHRRPNALTRSQSQLRTTSPISLASAPSRGEGRDAGSGAGDSLPASVTQQLVRCRDEGGESFTGLLRVDFAAGEQTQFAHISFFPPFATAPEVHVAQVSGPEATVKVTQTETFGLRIELRRSASEREPMSLVLEIEASAPAGNG